MAETYDLAAFRIPRELAQRWVLEFLTERGSMPFHLQERGTDFLRWLHSGVIRTELDVLAYFNFAAGQVAKTLAKERQPDDPLEEQLQSAQLQQVTLTEGGLILVVRLTSRAGETRSVQFAVPFSAAGVTG